MREAEEQPIQTMPGANRLLVFFLCSFVSSVVTAITALMMALGTGLASSPDEPVSRISQVLWGIGGLSFLPAAVLLIAVVASQRKNLGIALSVIVMAAGLLTAIGWFIDSGGDMPGTTVGDRMVVLVIVVPLVAGAIMLWQSFSLKDWRKM